MGMNGNYTFSRTTQLEKTHRSTQKKPGEQVRASGTHTSLSRVRNIWLMTLSEKKVMASHCTKDGEKMEQRPSPVLAERKRTLELSPRSSPHTQHQADKLPHRNISALPSTFVTNNSQKGKEKAGPYAQTQHCRQDCPQRDFVEHQVHLDFNSKPNHFFFFR